MSEKFYAFAPSLNPTTLDVDISGGTWIPSDPLAQKVLRILRTSLGEYLPDPTYGVDVSVIQKQRPGLQAIWKAEVERALGRLVARKELSDLRVIVDPPTRGRLFYDVIFRDPRNPNRAPQRIRQAA